jgi:hypothetical protein
MLAHLAERPALLKFLKPLRRRKWFVYAKRPFAGPKAVLAYLARYTHRVAISNRRLIRADVESVTFKVKDYRVEGPGRYTTMTLATHEFIRRFLMHVLPKGLHRIRHYGLLTNGNCAANLVRMRELLDATAPDPERADKAETATTEKYAQPYAWLSRVRKSGLPDFAKKLRENKGLQAGIRWATNECLLMLSGGPMRIIETVRAGSMPRVRASPPAVIRIDTS